MTIVATWLMGGTKVNATFISMNVGLLVMLAFLMMYFVKIGGTLPEYSTILFGNKALLDYVRTLPITLDDIALYENLFRVLVAYLYFLCGVKINLDVGKRFAKNKLYYLLSALPALFVVVASNPTIMLTTLAYKYDIQTFIVNVSFIVILGYIAFSVFLFICEYRKIALSWYKRRHMDYTISMVMFSVLYVIFAQFDPIIIYQDYNRVSVFTHPILLVSTNPTNVWFLVFIICIIACVFMIYQNFRYFKYDYDRTKLELTIKRKVTDAELGTSMLLHGLKNQLLSAKILNKKIANGIDDDEIDREELKKLTIRLLDINEDMSGKLSYLYKTMTNVHTVFTQCTTQELFDIVIPMVQKKDMDSIVEFKLESGSVLIDKELLSEAIFNVVSNAIDAVAQNDYKKIVVRMFFTRSHAVISVTDNGVGMSNEVKKKIFMPFTSSKNSDTNWGLGLCYARRIVKEHMGDIRFESKVLQGTTFYISLPRYLRGGKDEQED